MKSRISKLFIGRILTFSILSLLILFWSIFKIIQETTKDFPTMSTIFIIGSLGILIYCIGDSFSFKKITVSDNSIEIIQNVGFRKKTFSIENLSEINMKREEGLYSKSGKISDGYYYTELIFKTGENLIISPDHYENYRELIFEIKKGIKKQIV